MGTQTIFSFFKTHKKTIFYSILIVGYVLFTTHGAFAQDPQAGLSKEDSDKLISYLNMALKACAAVLGLATSFISIFLYPGWVNGTMFGLQDYLKEIWILVSNVVYFIFAGILIVIAFMNIINKGEGIWELKQAMPRFIVGVLIVPFSWFMVQFLLSLSAILTVGVLTLPYNSFQNEALFQGAMANSEIANQKFCKDIILNFGDEQVGTAVTDGENNFSENIRCKSEDAKVSIQEIISGEGAGEGVDNSVFGVISVYTYGILRVQEFDTVVAGDLTTVKGIMDLIFKIIFDLLFVIVYALLMVALFLALLTRGIRLWVYMMLSPIFGLLYFLGKTGKDGGSDKFNPREFVALALVPVYVAAALAFGLTFIMVASEGIKQESSSTDMDTLQAGGFSLSIVGAHADGEEEKSVIGKLIVELFGVAILWIAVMAALGASETTKAIVKPIADFGESVGKLAAAAPTYAPIIPTGNGGAMSITGLQQVGSSVTSSVEQGARQRGTDFAKTLPGMNPTSMDLGQKSVDALTEFNNSSNKLTNQSVSTLRAAIQEGGNVETLSQNAQFLNTINTIVEQDDRFASIRSKGNVRNGRHDDLAILLSEMDNIIDNTPSLGTLMAGRVAGTVTGDSVNTRIAGSATPTEAGDITNNITISGVGGATPRTFTTPEEAGQAFARDTSFTTVDEVRTKLRAENIEENVIASIVIAYEAGRQAPPDTNPTA